MISERKAEYLVDKNPNHYMRQVGKPRETERDRETVCKKGDSPLSQASVFFFQMELAASSSTTVLATKRPNLDGLSMSCLGRPPTRHTNTILDVGVEVQRFHLFLHLGCSNLNYRSLFCRSAVLFPMKKKASTCSWLAH